MPAVNALEQHAERRLSVNVVVRHSQSDGHAHEDVQRGHNAHGQHDGEGNVLPGVDGLLVTVICQRASKVQVSCFWRRQCKLTCNAQTNTLQMEAVLHAHTDTRDAC